jgi:uncharacterized protein (DUF433 family)
MAWASLMGFERISVDHQVMGGVPCIRGTRIPVAKVVSLVAEGSSAADIVTGYPQLDVADVRAAPELLRDAGHDAVHGGDLGHSASRTPR